MKKLILIFSLLASVASAQTATYNVTITNNLVNFGPNAFDGSIFTVTSTGVQLLVTSGSITGAIDGQTLYLTSSVTGGTGGDLSALSNGVINVGLVASNALPRSGGTMTGGLTNEAGFFGDGSGLTKSGTASPGTVCHAQGRRNGLRARQEFPDFRRDTALRQWPPG